MDTLEQIRQDIKTAMKGRDAETLRVLRSLKAKLMEREISERKSGEEVALSEAQVAEVLMKAAKQRKESIEQFEQGGRPELAESEQRELAIIESYLPEMMSEEELRKLVKQRISELGATGPGDIGNVMGSLMGELQGRADGALVSKVVKQILAG